ncbi:MAG: histidine kinase [Bacteroidales bacterium]|nr:histidine kinase [Bacteroidales bacterium]
MDPIKKKEIIIHAILTLMVVALFGIWYTYTLSRSPGRQPFGPPASHGMSETRPGPPPDAPNGHKGPMKPENAIIIFGILSIIGVNYSALSYFRSVRQEQRMKDLENEKLDRQLQTLRYQINPHFFMNTLNNIHALVDIDPEKSKESIEVFSKLMRIVLYEGDSPTIPLMREIEYLKHYVSLMRLRFPENVRIDTSFPDDTEGLSVPPLLFASFAENAFKHGISHDHDSFVRISIARENDRLIFRCVNSKTADSSSSQHGIGIDNTRQRLNLLYGSSYSLNIEDTDNVYDLLLILPI